jgi:hypothetical protein
MAAAELEQHLKTDPSQSGPLFECLEHISQAFTRLRACINEYPQEADHAEPQITSREAALALLNELRGLLQEDDFQALVLLQKNAATFRCLFSEEYLEIEALIAAYDFESALQRLSEKKA